MSRLVTKQKPNIQRSECQTRLSQSSCLSWTQSFVWATSHPMARRQDYTPQSRAAHRHTTHYRTSAESQGGPTWGAACCDPHADGQVWGYFHRHWRREATCHRTVRASWSPVSADTYWIIRCRPCTNKIVHCKLLAENYMPPSQIHMYTVTNSHEWHAYSYHCCYMHDCVCMCLHNYVLQTPV